MVVAAFPGGREVEMKLPGRYRLDPAVRGAIKTAPGVAALEDV
jgi:DNA polymerase-3 subunit alpha